MKIIVFGGGGFIGSAIVDRLLHEGHSIRVFERPRIEPYRQFKSSEDVEWITGDLLSKHDVSEAMRDTDVVYHLVSTTLPKSSNDDPLYDVQTNLVASLQMLEVMVENDVKRIVFISSGGTVYGIPQYLPIDEVHPTNPEVSYGITKLAIEKYILMYGRLHGIKPIILRVANPYGPRQRIETAQGAVGVFIHRALNDKPIEIWGDGTVRRDFLYIDDVADAFAKAAHYTGKHSVFNISSGVGVSLNELMEMIETLQGKSLARTYKAGRPFDVPISVLDNRLAGVDLDWIPKVSIRDGIEMTMQWIGRQR